MKNSSQQPVAEPPQPFMCRRSACSALEMVAHRAGVSAATQLPLQLLGRKVGSVA